MPTISYATRWEQKGTRPVRVANCSGAKPDQGYQMLRQATQGDVDFITGDYLAEMNLAENAEAFAAGKHDGWEPTAWDGLQQSLDIVAEKNIKVVINGGSLNPAGLAKKVEELARSKGLSLKVGYVEGDNFLPEMREMLEKERRLPEHLDPEDCGITLAKNARAYLEQGHPLVSANVYLGARGIVEGLRRGADIIICGRVADASPVIGAAWYWHNWSDKDFNCLAGALIAGHLIECSAYVTGGNFAGFTDYDLDDLVDIPFGIAEMEADGSCIITKHEGTRGMVNEDTVICQFLYELQGNVYLNSDVKAYIENISVVQAGPDRVRVSGIKGAPPPRTTKLAIFYKGGFQTEWLMNATGYGTAKKWQLQQKQVLYGLKQKSMLDKFDILQFQPIGTPAANPRTQLSSTTYLRIFAQSTSVEPLVALIKTITEYAMQHYSGMHGTLDKRGAMPLPFLAFYPAIWPQEQIKEHVTIIGTDTQQVAVGHPPEYEDLGRRLSYDTQSPMSLTLVPQRTVRLGDICLARSGDKGANVNFGLYARRSLADQDLAWDWLRSYMSRAKMQEILADDWRDDYAIERVEFVGIRAVHFVIYGLLGRGVSSATSLDPLGKGFADYIRDKTVEVPAALVPRDDAASIAVNGRL